MNTTSSRHSRTRSKGSLPVGAVSSVSDMGVIYFVVSDLVAWWEDGDGDWFEGSWVNMHVWSLKNGPDWCAVVGLEAMWVEHTKCGLIGRACPSGCGSCLAPVEFVRLSGGP